MIKSLVPNYDNFKEILSDFQESAEGVIAFVDEIKAKVDLVGRHRFSAKKDKKQDGKWVVPQFSGFLIREAARIQLVVRGCKAAESLNKKVNHAIEIVCTEEGIKSNPIILKKSSFLLEQDLKHYLETINIHIEIAIKLARFGSFNHRPDLLSIHEKKSKHIVVIKEPKCYSDLIRWESDTLPPFIDGMERILKYLAEVRERKLVFSDIKRGNILVKENVFFLSDFKSLKPIGFKGTPQKYFAWCSTAEKLGIFTSFTDVFGWTITFGCTLWETHFLNVSLDKEKLHSAELKKSVWKALAAQDLIPEEISLPRYAHLLDTYEVDPDKLIKIHFLFYRFLKRVLECDQANLKHYEENPDNPNPYPQITLEHCQEFLRTLR